MLRPIATQWWWQIPPATQRWLLLNATLGALDIYLPLKHFQGPAFLPNCTKGPTLHLTLLTKMLSPQKRWTLISSLWDGANSAVSIWNIQQGAIKDKWLEQLEKAMGLVTSAALTHLTVATAALKHTAELALYTRDTLRELIKTIIEARHQLAWDSVCVPKSNNI